jgi:RND family efflux transporter MFP subunit
VVLKVIVKLMNNRSFTLIFLKREALLGLFTGLSIFLWSVSLYAGEKLSFSGITEPIKDVKLSMLIEGRISTIFFKEGDRIKKGQHILDLDKNLENLETMRRKLIWESKVELEAAKTRELLIKSQLESVQKLFENAKGISKEKLQEKELEYKLSVAERKRLEIEEERKRIEYEMALENLRKRTLKSPIDGVIIKLFLDEGESCEPEQPLVHIVDTNKSLFVCYIEEKIGRTLKKGQSVNLKIRAGNGYIDKRGMVIFTSPVVDSSSGLQEIKVEFDNDDGVVRPGISGLLLLNLP